MAPLVRRNFAQSNKVTERSMIEESRLRSFILEPKFLHPGKTADYIVDRVGKDPLVKLPGAMFIGIG